MKLDIKVGDIILTGKWRNKRTEVKEIGTDEMGQPTINGKQILKFRIEKTMKKNLNEMKHIKLFENFGEESNQIFSKTGYGVGINVNALKSFLEKFGVTFKDSSDLLLSQPLHGRYMLEIELSSMSEMIPSSTWEKLRDAFMDMGEYVEDTSENTNKNRFIIDLVEGMEYDLEINK